MNSIVWFILYIHHPPTRVLEVFFVPTDTVQEFLYPISTTVDTLLY